MRLLSSARWLPLVVATALLLSACGSESAAPGASALDSSAVPQDSTFDGSLTQILRREQRFRVFSTLLDSAGLLPALRRGGPYTVFAATSPGIDKMPEGLVDELLLPDNRDRLRQVMAYHVHRGRLSKDSLRGMDSVSTLSGQALPISVEGRRVLIGENRLSEYTLTGSNGRLFAFDALAMPPVGGATNAAPRIPSAYDSLGGDFGTGTGGESSGSSSSNDSTSGSSSSSSGSSSSGSSSSGSSGDGGS
jgi:uncharacterized surface protein with fasciclin (FAS1) repeats